MALLGIALSTLIASILTFYTGFGLGTLVLPALLIFFPVEAAIAVTAMIHLLHNGFKLSLLWRHTNWPVALKFGLPALVSAVAGAKLLSYVSGLPAVGTIELFGNSLELMPVKLTVAVVMAALALLEINPRFRELSIPAGFLPLGGLVSGFFGGLTGHQGAFRALFLLRSGVGKEAFIATGTVIAIIVDLSRLSVYLPSFKPVTSLDQACPIIVAAVCVVAGTIIGRRFLAKVTLAQIERLVAAFLIGIAVLLALGLI